MLSLKDLSTLLTLPLIEEEEPPLRWLKAGRGQTAAAADLSV